MNDLVLGHSRSTARRPDEWVWRIRRSIAAIQKARELEPTHAWDHGGAYVLARSLGAVAPGSPALGILILTAVGAPRPLINDELRRLGLWDGAMQIFTRNKSIPVEIDKLGDQWVDALASVPRHLYRVNRVSRFGAIYHGPRWWEK
jgi:hypothetical protein